MERKNRRTQVSLGSLGSIIWYPFLFAAYPVLALLVHNLGQVRPEVGSRPVLAAVLAAGVLVGLFRLLLKDWHRAAFVTAVWLALFEAYGHVYLSLEEKAPQYAQTSLLGGAALTLALVALFVATRPRVRFEAWAVPLNVAALALVVFPIVQIISSQMELKDLPPVSAQASTVEVNGPKPDIYYIVLDMYTRADTLQAAYGFDNSGFINDLEDAGFQVADCAMSNYTRTELSLASALNMTYLTSDLDPRINPTSEARTPMWTMIRDNAVMDFARARGYKTVAFATGFSWSELDNADLYLQPGLLRGGLTEFESLWLDTTAFRVLEDEGKLDVRPIAFNRYRERTQYVLDTLPALPELDGPKFVFVHLILPHPPFVFAADGSRLDAVSFLNENEQYTAQKFQEGYTTQIAFANREVSRIVREIIARSKVPPVIILQGDHGPWLQPRDRHMTILNAYYLPGHADVVTSDMSPVNTFRLVFDLYLGGKFDLLENTAYYSPVPNQYDFSAVPNRCKTR